VLTISDHEADDGNDDTDDQDQDEAVGESGAGQAAPNDEAGYTNDDDDDSEKKPTSN
jgi:hypothetical protein